MCRGMFCKERAESSKAFKYPGRFRIASLPTVALAFAGIRRAMDTRALRLELLSTRAFDSLDSKHTQFKHTHTL